MPLDQNSLLGQGGIGMHGTGEGTAAQAIKELQSLRIAVVTGAAANTKLAVADIRQRDTVLSALNNNAGAITDVTGTITIDDLRAKGTITVGTAVAADTVTVAGKTFTLVATIPGVDNPDYTLVKIGATAAETAANLAAAVNKWQSCLNVATVIATAATNVVTITAVAEGVAGNAITLVKVGTSFTVSGAVLAGGNATGGIRSSGITNSLILFWFDKPV